MNIIRWFARITGTLLVIFVLFFAVGSFVEGLKNPGPGLNMFTVITFVVWGIGLAGLVFAWWKEGAGGMISLISFIVFNILVAINPTPGSSYTLGLLLFLFPSILFLLYWWLRKRSSGKNS